MSEDVYGQVPVFFPDKEPIYPLNEKEYAKAILSVEKGGLGGSRNYIPKHYPRRIYRYDDKGEVVLAVSNNAEEFQAQLEAGWSGTPLAPPLPPPEKDVTKAEYEANMRTAKAELRAEALEKRLDEMMALLKEKESKPAKGHKGDAA